MSGLPGKTSGGEEAKIPQNGIFVSSFVDDTVQKTGRKKTVIYDKLEIAANIDEDVKKETKSCGINKSGAKKLTKKITKKSDFLC